MNMDRSSMMEFAEDWIANWNRRDVDAVLAHFTDDAEFTSPLAREVAGCPVLKGKEALASYWCAALDRHPVLQFRLDHANWDDARRELTVVYRSDTNDRQRRSCEIMTFDPAGRQIRGEAFYGADV